MKKAYVNWYFYCFQIRNKLECQTVGSPMTLELIILYRTSTTFLPFLISWCKGKRPPYPNIVLHVMEPLCNAENSNIKFQKVHNLFDSHSELVKMLPQHKNNNPYCLQLQEILFFARYENKKRNASLWVIFFSLRFTVSMCILYIIREDRGNWGVRYMYMRWFSWY